jgi:hypothetical protein
MYRGYPQRFGVKKNATFVVVVCHVRATGGKPIVRYEMKKGLHYGNRKLLSFHVCWHNCIALSAKKA